MGIDTASFEKKQALLTDMYCRARTGTFEAGGEGCWTTLRHRAKFAGEPASWMPQNSYCSDLKLPKMTDSIARSYESSPTENDHDPSACRWSFFTVFK